MAHSISIKRQVQFSETDMAGLMHFSNYFKFMEEAELAFFESLGLKLVEISPDAFTGWPRLGVSCRFFTPLYFQDQVTVQLFVKSFSDRSICYFFRFSRLEKEEPVTTAEGEMETVFARLNPQTREMHTDAFPPEYLEKLEEAPPELWRF